MNKLTNFYSPPCLDLLIRYFHMMVWDLHEASFQEQFSPSEEKNHSGNCHRCLGHFLSLNSMAHALVNEFLTSHGLTEITYKSIYHISVVGCHHFRCWGSKARLDLHHPHFWWHPTLYIFCFLLWRKTAYSHFFNWRYFSSWTSRTVLRMTVKYYKTRLCHQIC